MEALRETTVWTGVEYKTPSPFYFCNLLIKLEKHFLEII